ncbi:hypothetical protein KIH87_05625 [Paraneptunicella aestuarii]|uniref:hypothetical protein n=1 Tax=Paraneptunicella aestuarii TaxID=2831148 RepID=UPI001E286D1C|nr:hypothetical protein [Paraneptunicella aestuarii]UAA39834.1 hypothetical protein KIH87_05625 [Paraneptunicella aestuarii]
MNRTVIILTIILTFGFTSSSVWANSGSQGFTIAKSGGGVFPPEKATYTVNKSGDGAFPPDKTAYTVSRGGGGAFPPDPQTTINQTEDKLCLLGYCFSSNN